MSPSVSQNQAVAMNIAKAVQEGKAPATPGQPSTEIAQSMPPQTLNEFTGPVNKELPMRKAAPKARAKPRGGGGGIKTRNITKSAGGARKIPW